MIATCSKCYFVDVDGSEEHAKLSTKGISRRQKKITWQRFKAVLAGGKDTAVNRGFRLKGGQMVIYHEKKLGLSAYYDKRWVLLDGIHTEPLEYHLAAIQRVVVKGEASDWLTIASGVPQGSLLGPLFFIVYINDLPGIISKDSSIALYADDSKMYRVINTQEELSTSQSDR